MAGTQAPKTLRLSDYRKPEFTTSHVDLNFDIHEDKAFVTSTVTYDRTAEGKGVNALVLSAQNPNTSEGDTSGAEPYIQGIILNGRILNEGTDYVFDNAAQTLTIPLSAKDASAKVEIRTVLKPEKNTELSGFYKAGPVFCTQCESEGFRRITPFLDRPDVMATYDVRIESDASIGDVLLSNGNPMTSGTTATGRHFATWNDPHPKPCYLFALVSGDLEHIEEKYTTASGRDVTLRIYTEQGQKDRARFAMESLIKSMVWDEKVYGREYDLDLFNIVAVSNFTFGAMENKSLNIFAAKYVFADPETETDVNFHGVDRVVAHEYFHNWTGNRVTLENWFHIALKEGFTVFRDQEYSADHGDRDLERIQQVASLRARQFPADDSALAFPVLPKEVESITNIYGATTYDKAAELLRMIRTMIGVADFRRASDLYFDRYDGQAVRIENLVQCFEDVSGFPFRSGQFMNWYHQSGRPRVNATTSYDPATQELTLTLEQSTPPSKDQAVKQPFLIPVRMGLIDLKTGQEIDVDVKGDSAAPAKEKVLHFSQAKQDFVFKNVPQSAVPSLLRGFSAPVDLTTDLTNAELIGLMTYDTDGFNKWDAVQKVMSAELLRQYAHVQKKGAADTINPDVSNALKTGLQGLSPAMAAEFLTLPGIGSLETALGGKAIDPLKLSIAVKETRNQIVDALANELDKAYTVLHDANAPYVFNTQEAGKRSLKNKALTMLAARYGTDDVATNAAQLSAIGRGLSQYSSANNMTDRVGALAAAGQFGGQASQDLFDDFKAKYRHDIPTIQKWFTLIAQGRDATDKVRDVLEKDSAFNHSIAHNWHALIGAYAGNYGAFHQASGKGYALVADGVLKADKINSSVAAKLAEPLCNWQKYVPAHADLMVKELRRIAATPGISNNLKANVLKALPTDAPAAPAANTPKKGRKRTPK